jgi:ABC-type phosphate/phosphonate transport system substrate-binding protein
MNLASLPMYDLPELASATAAFWQGLARHLRRAGIADAPDMPPAGPALPDHWLSPELLLSQTCGYPLLHGLKDRVRLVATPCYAAPGCEGPTYCSVIIVPREVPAATLADLKGCQAAFNSLDSQSGFNALRAAIASLAEAGRFFGQAIETGSHVASLELVAAGGADVAALDCVSFALFQRCGWPAMERVRVLARTASAPSLPFITAAATDDERLLRLRQGLRAAMADPALAQAREALLLRDIMLLPDSAYDVILDMERAAIAAGYPRLN